MALGSNKADRLALQQSLTANYLGLQGALGSINDAEPKAAAALGSGYADARDSYGKAADLFTPYIEMGKDANGIYVDSLGLNGDEGNSRAVAAFHASPGYDWSVDQATDAVARKASAMGSLGSGNTAAAISDRAGHMADQQYGSWQDRLQGLGSQGLSATGAVANLTKGQGDLSAAEGIGLAALYGDSGRARANAYLGTASTTGSAWNNYANQVANTDKTTASLISGGLGLGANLLGLKSSTGGTVGSSLLKSLGWSTV